MATAVAAAPKSLDDKSLWEGDDSLPDEVKNASMEEITKLTRLLENDIKALKNDASRLNLEQKREKERIKENNDKIKLNRQLPYLVGNIVEV